MDNTEDTLCATFRVEFCCSRRELSKDDPMKSQKIEALKNISFKVKKGSMLALLGPNGAGKSTLINILAGIVNKSSGTAIINGFKCK